MVASAGEAADWEEALEQDPHEGGRKPCWHALARVIDDDPTFVLQEGEKNGMSVTCMVQTGPFEGVEVAALVSCPLGGGFESRPLRGGMRVVLLFLDGTLNGGCVAVASVPGGAENALPKAMAGLGIDEGGLDNSQLVAPPKGVNLRFYIRGAAFVVRLKGAQEGYAGEFYLEGDDGDAQGLNNTFFRLVLNPNTKKLAIKARLSDGTEIALDDGVASMTSGTTSIQVSKDDAKILAKTFYVEAGTIALNGLIFANVPPGAPPVPAMAALRGVGGPLAAPSLGFFIGA
jgi:hypothetical protein